MQDRTIYEDSVFAKVRPKVCIPPSVVQYTERLLTLHILKVLKDSRMMEEREYETYRSLFSNMSNFMYVVSLIQLKVKGHF